MKLFNVTFEGMYPVGNCLLLLAESEFLAVEMARSTITHTDKFDVKEVDMNEPKIVIYLSGEY